MRNLVWLVLLGCGGAESTSQPAVAEGGPGNTELVQLQAEQPAPLMRQAIMCCADLKLEKVIESYLSLGELLAGGSVEGVDAPIDAMKEVVAGSNHLSSALSSIVEFADGVDRSSLDALRSGFGALTEPLLSEVRGASSVNGQYDLALGYSRDSDSHWLQLGVEPKSPYGDGINSYSWGSREDVNAADAAREREMGNDQLGSAP